METLFSSAITKSLFDSKRKEREKKNNNYGIIKNNSFYKYKWRNKTNKLEWAGERRLCMALLVCVCVCGMHSTKLLDWWKYEKWKFFYSNWKVRVRAALITLELIKNNNSIKTGKSNWKIRESERWTEETQNQPCTHTHIQREKQPVFDIKFSHKTYFHSSCVLYVSNLVFFWCFRWQTETHVLREVFSCIFLSMEKYFVARALVAVTLPISFV